MRSDLRLLSLGDIFDEAFDLYKRNFALLAGIAVVAQAPAHIAYSAATRALGLDQFGEDAPASNLNADIGAVTLWLLATVAYLVVFLLEAGALTTAISERYLGRPITMGRAWRHALRSAGRLLVTWLFVFCLLAIAGILVLIACAVLLGAVAGFAAMGNPSGDSPLFVVVGMLVFIVPAFAVLCCCALFGAFVTQIAVIENTAYFDAVGRNWRLTQARFFRAVSGVLLILVFSAGLVMTMDFFLQGLLDLTLYSWLPVSALTRNLVEDIWLSLISTFLQPFWLAVLTILYYDQRVRREGFDLALSIHRLFAPAQGAGR